MQMRPPALLLAALAPLAGPAVAAGPVKAVVEGRFTLPGGGQLPIAASRDWSAPLPGIHRTVVVIHGQERDADVYFASALAAQRAAGPAGADALILAPQFLDAADARAHALAPDVLRWAANRWPSGNPALSPASASSYTALDAILARLADRTLFPDLREVVIAGHSAGGQMVQRYAVVGEGEAALTRAGIHLRYVAANPSSYLYFSSDRPVAVTNCHGENAWRYGFAAGLPAYVRGTPASLEQRYVARDVTYLLGDQDTNPNHPALDKSCAGEAQGPYRLARGLNYFAYLQVRDGTALRHALHEVPGVAHQGRGMLTSACGVAALFGTDGCQ